MTTALTTHPACLEHIPPAGHPESPDRLQRVLEALRGPAFSDLVWMEAPEATREQLSRAHTPELVSLVLDRWASAAKNQHYVRIDADTAMSAGSADAALHAAGACIRAVDAIAAGAVQNAFCAVRPPGHHAERNRAMGFCLFNNIAVAAQHARERHGCSRIAIVDFDVHHGNGSQDIFWSDPNTLYASSHQSPHYPGTGDRLERGDYGNIVNIPLAPGSDGRVFRKVYENVILPAVEAFEPDFVFISAGFDAHLADPLADLLLNESDFGWVTGELCAIANRHCGGRVVSTLEGGYDLQALADSAAAHVRALMEA